MDRLEEGGQELEFNLHNFGDAKDATKLPNNIWGVIVVLILHGVPLPKHMPSWLAIFVLPMLAALAATCFLQSVFIVHIASIANDSGASCLQGQTFSDKALVWSCLFVFVGSIVYNDLDETAAMIVYQHQFQNRLVEEATAESKPGIRVGADGDVRSRLGPGARALIYAVLLVKIAISVAVAHYGVGFVAQSASNKDALLNAVAMLFILEVDELVYKLVIPQGLKERVQQAPSLFTDDKSRMGLVRRLSLFAKIGSTVVIVCLLQWTWCECGLPHASTPWVSTAFIAVGGLAGFLLSLSYLFCSFLFTVFVRLCAARCRKAGKPSAPEQPALEQPDSA